MGTRHQAALENEMTTPYIWGSNEFGQLGLNEDEKEFKEKLFKKGKD